MIGEEPAVSLFTEVVDVLVEERILASEETLFLRHPVRRSVPIVGNIAIEHRPAFVQQNGHLYVMETVDFTIMHKRNARDHAGWAAYMFKDIRDKNPATQPIAIVRLTEDDKQHDEVRNGLALLHHEGEIVNWLTAEERAAFIDERKRLAA